MGLRARANHKSSMGHVVAETRVNLDSFRNEKSVDDSTATSPRNAALSRRLISRFVPSGGNEKETGTLSPRGQMRERPRRDDRPWGRKKMTAIDGRPNDGC